MKKKRGNATISRVKDSMPPGVRIPEHDEDILPACPMTLGVTLPTKDRPPFLTERFLSNEGANSTPLIGRLRAYYRAILISRDTRHSLKGFHRGFLCFSVNIRAIDIAADHLALTDTDLFGTNVQIGMGCRGSRPRLWSSAEDSGF
ncbi:MAG: hypothetical protein ABR903_01255 [Thermodesulfovibrionales bacterium]|jgi:hypothetical protein